MAGTDTEAGAGADFDSATLDELRSLVGAKVLVSFLERLQGQMAASFEAPPLEAGGLAAAAHQANALSSISGMLGFHALSNASAALETACGSPLATPSSIVPPLADVLAARARAEEIIEALLSGAAEKSHPGGRPSADPANGETGHDARRGDLTRLVRAGVGGRT